MIAYMFPLPPHLPPPASSLPRHRQWERIKILFIASFFGILSGFAGAAIILSWATPSFGESANLFINKTFGSTSKELIAAKAEQKIADKIFAVYQKSTTVGKARYFSPGDKIGDGIVGVTSGWLVVYFPNFSSITKDWIAVSPSGSLYSVDHSLFDKRTGLVYLKVVPLQKSTIDEQFKVVTFNNTLSQDDSVFVFEDGRWQSTVNLGQVPGKFETHLDTVQPLLFNVADTFKDGSVATDSSGNVVGFVAGHSTVLPLSGIDYFLNGIDGKKQIVYPTLGIEGWYGDERILVLNDEKVTGFLVAKVVGNKSSFAKNDIILEVNGRPAEWGSIWNAVGNSVVQVTLYRNGRTLTETVPTIQL